jgi:hypothetical protein
VFEPRARENSPVPDLEVLRAQVRPFGRLRPQTETAPRGATDAWRPADPARPAVLPLQSIKTFVGPSGTYYDECWRSMAWRGQNRSWNWAAALTFGGWLAYRRLYGCAVLHSAWLILLMLLAASGASTQSLAFAQAAVATALGLYGNTLYQGRFRKAAMAAGRHDGDYEAQLAALAAAGGVDGRAVWMLVLAMAAAAALIVRFGDRWAIPA